MFIKHLKNVKYLYENVDHVLKKCQSSDWNKVNVYRKMLTRYRKRFFILKIINVSFEKY